MSCECEYITFAVQNSEGKIKAGEQSLQLYYCIKGFSVYVALRRCYQFDLWRQHVKLATHFRTVCVQNRERDGEQQQKNTWKQNKNHLNENGNFYRTYTHTHEPTIPMEYYCKYKRKRHSYLFAYIVEEK